MSRLLQVLPRCVLVCLFNEMLFALQLKISRMLWSVDMVSAEVSAGLLEEGPHCSGSQAHLPKNSSTCRAQRGGAWCHQFMLLLLVMCCLLNLVDAGGDKGKWHQPPPSSLDRYSVLAALRESLSEEQTLSGHVSQASLRSLPSPYLFQTTCAPRSAMPLCSVAGRKTEF